MKKKFFLTTGEFAKLCNTTKETLFHYDRENLLKPKHLSENGYRYYGAEQFFDFDMIAMLKDAGSSLKEVRESIQNTTDGMGFLSLFKNKLHLVRKERDKLTQRENMLRDMVTGTREALNFQYDTFMVLEEQEERFETFATTGTMEDSIIDFVERFAEYSAFYEKQGMRPRSPFGVILEQKDVVRGHYQERYYFSRATRYTPHSSLHIKPEGRYAVIAHRGTVETHKNVFKDFLQHIRSAGLTVSGNGYCYDMMSYLLLDLNASYAVKYCILVN